MIGRTWNDSKKLKHTAEERERKKWRYHSRLFVRQDDSRHNMCAAPATYGSHCISNHPLYYADNAIWHVYVACDRGTNCLMCSSVWWNFESRKGEELSLNLVCDRAFGFTFPAHLHTWRVLRKKARACNQEITQQTAVHVNDISDVGDDTATTRSVMRIGDETENHQRCLRISDG